MSKYSKLAKQALKFFTAHEQGFVLRDGTPEWVSNLVQAAHGDMFPDNWRYTLIHRVLEAMADGGDYEADVYRGDLIDWLDSHAIRMGYCDEVLEELVLQSTFELLQAGQLREMEEIHDIILGVMGKMEDA